MLSHTMELRLGSSSAIREAFEKAERLKADFGDESVFDFSIGNPTAPCPTGVKEALCHITQHSCAAIHGYMDASGYESVRASVASSLTKRFGVCYSPEDIVMTSGAACALNVILQSILDDNDEVVTLLPCYPAYSSFIQNWGGRAVPIPFDGDTLLPNLDALASSISPKTKAIIVNSPNNPTGLVYPRRLALRIADILQDANLHFGHDILLISDEPYRDLVYEGAENPYWPCYYTNTLVVYSFSKAASIAGERIGYIAFTPKMSEKAPLRQAVLRSLGDLGFVNAPATAQRLAEACIDDLVDIGFYDKNRLCLCESLEQYGFSPLRPNGALYLLLPACSKNASGIDSPCDTMQPNIDRPFPEALPPFRDAGSSNNAVCFNDALLCAEKDLLERLLCERIVAVGGSAFGCPGYVRLSFCVSPLVIQRSLSGFKHVAKSLGLVPKKPRVSHDERSSR